jgi:hypothetical protein
MNRDDFSIANAGTFRVLAGAESTTLFASPQFLLPGVFSFESTRCSALKQKRLAI